MRRIVAFLSILSLSATFSAAQDQNAAEAKLREALKQMTVRVQTAESEAAAAKAVQADLETRNKTLATQLEKVTKDFTVERAAAEKAATAAEAKLTDREAELARVKESLDKWKAGHAQVAELARKAESARVVLAAKVAALDLRVADLTRKNLALYKLGDEVLTRLEKFSYGTALSAREPFVGTTRVRLENEVQGYKDRLLDPKLKP
jgi:DNA-binding HxlR family transcriptional regulator